MSEQRKLNALAEAMKLVPMEFASTKDAKIAAAGHVLSALIMRHVKALDRELDEILENTGM
jgi:hypothetical protein